MFEDKWPVLLENLQQTQALQVAAHRFQQQLAGCPPVPISNKGLWLQFFMPAQTEVIQAWGIAAKLGENGEITLEEDTGSYQSQPEVTAARKELFLNFVTEAVIPQVRAMTRLFWGTSSFNQPGFKIGLNGNGYSFRAVPVLDRLYIGVVEVPVSTSVPVEPTLDTTAG